MERRILPSTKARRSARPIPQGKRLGECATLPFVSNCYRKRLATRWRLCTLMRQTCSKGGQSAKAAGLRRPVGLTHSERPVSRISLENDGPRQPLIGLPAAPIAIPRSSMICCGPEGSAGRHGFDIEGRPINRTVPRYVRR